MFFPLPFNQTGGFNGEDFGNGTAGKQNARTGSKVHFLEIVKGLGGLVYHSALRRTGKAASAEEITQNVFALLAREAASLRSRKPHRVSAYC